MKPPTARGTSAKSGTVAEVRNATGRAYLEHIHFEHIHFEQIPFERIPFEHTPFEQTQKLAGEGALGGPSHFLREGPRELAMHGGESMKILVVGATGRTGRLVVQGAVEEGHGVRAFSRSVTADLVPDGVEVVAGDVCEPDDVRRAVEGVDAVIVALSMVRTSNSPWARITTPLDLHTRAARLLLPACADAGVRRYVTISAHGVGPSRPRAGWAFLALVHGSKIGVAYDNLAEAEQEVMACDLDWTIVRPTRLTDAVGTGRWKASADLVAGSFDRISRADLARFLVAAVSDGDGSRGVVSVTEAR